MFKVFNKRKSVIEKQKPDTGIFPRHIILQFENVGFSLKNGVPVLGTILIKYRNNNLYKVNTDILKDYVYSLQNTHIVSKINDNKIRGYTDKISNFLYNDITYNKLAIKLYNSFDFNISFQLNSDLIFKSLIDDSYSVMNIIPNDVLDSESFYPMTEPLKCLGDLKSSMQSLKAYSTNFKTQTDKTNKCLIIHQENYEGIVYFNDILRYIISIRLQPFWSIQDVYDDFHEKLKSNKDSSLVIAIHERIDACFSKIELVYDKETDFVIELLDNKNTINYKYH